MQKDYKKILLDSIKLLDKWANTGVHEVSTQIDIDINEKNIATMLLIQYIEKSYDNFIKQPEEY